MSFCICFSPPIVGAYRIRPDVGERGMKEASIPLLFREHSPLPDIFAAMEGVCDTPLHIYLLFAGDTVMRRVVLYLFFAVNCRGVSHTP